MIFPRHETRDAPIVSGVAMARRSVLKTLATTTRDPREVRTKVIGRIRKVRWVASRIQRPRHVQYERVEGWQGRERSRLRVGSREIKWLAS